MGWGNPAIIGGFAVGIAAIVAFIKIEEKAAEPLIPLRLFGNQQYTMLLVIGFICYFYTTAMNTYAPIGAMKVLGASTGLAGSLQFPRTILTMVLPTVAGVWVGKKSANAWKAMAIGTLLVAVPMLALGFTNAAMPIAVYFVAITVTGVAESFRAVSITPTAQATLPPADMGVGTSLVNFVNSLANTIAAAVFGVAYNMNTAADPTNAALIQNGVCAVFMTAAVVTFVGFLLVVFVIRPKLQPKGM